MTDQSMLGERELKALAYFVTRIKLSGAPRLRPAAAGLGRIIDPASSKPSPNPCMAMLASRHCPI